MEGKDGDRMLSVFSLILGILSLIGCFVLGYAGPFAGALAAVVALIVARHARKTSPDSINKAGVAVAVAGLIINAVSALAMLLMALLGAAYLGSAGSLF